VCTVLCLFDSAQTQVEMHYVCIITCSD
jgi:hypothetical protein